MESLVEIKKEDPGINDIIDGKLFMSDLSAAENLEILTEKKITHIITACRNVKPKYPEKFTYFVIDVKDEITENIK